MFTKLNLLFISNRADLYPCVSVWHLPFFERILHQLLAVPWGWLHIWQQLKFYYLSWANNFGKIKLFTISMYCRSLYCISSVPYEWVGCLPLMLAKIFHEYKSVVNLAVDGTVRLIGHDEEVFITHYLIINERCKYALQYRDTYLTSY